MKTLIILAALVAATFSTTAADAKKAPTKTLKSSGTINGHNIQANGADGSFTFAGKVTDKSLGQGAIVATGTNNPDNSIDTTFTFFTKDGTLTGKIHFTAMASAMSGFVDVSGQQTITGGTGKYKGAKGTGTVTGTDELATNYYAFTYNQSFKVKK